MIPKPTKPFAEESYLDLRRPNLHKNIVLRSNVISFMRRRMTERFKKSN